MSWPLGLQILKSVLISSGGKYLRFLNITFFEEHKQRKKRTNFGTFISSSAIYIFQKVCHSVISVILLQAAEHKIKRRCKIFGSETKSISICAKMMTPEWTDTKIVVQQRVRNYDVRLLVHYVHCLNGTNSKFCSKKQRQTFNPSFNINNLLTVWSRVLF